MKIWFTFFFFSWVYYGKKKKVLSSPHKFKSWGERGGMGCWIQIWIISINLWKMFINKKCTWMKLDQIKKASKVKVIYYEFLFLLLLLFFEIFQIWLNEKITQFGIGLLAVKVLTESKWQRWCRSCYVAKPKNWCPHLFAILNLPTIMCFHEQQNWRALMGLKRKYVVYF